MGPMTLRPTRPKPAPRIQWPGVAEAGESEPNRCVEHATPGSDSCTEYERRLVPAIGRTWLDLTPMDASREIQECFALLHRGEIEAWTTDCCEVRLYATTPRGRVFLAPVSPGPTNASGAIIDFHGSSWKPGPPSHSVRAKRSTEQIGGPRRTET